MASWRETLGRLLGISGEFSDVQCAKKCDAVNSAHRLKNRWHTMSTIRPRGDKFQAIVRVKKGGVLVHTESRMFDTEPLAKSWADRVERDIKKNGVQARQRSSTTLAELILSYIKMREEIRPVGKSLLGDLNLLGRALGARKLDGLTTDVLVRFARDRRKEGAGPATVLHNLATLHNILGAAKPLLGVDTDASAVKEAMIALRNSGHVAKSESRDRRCSDIELDALVAEFNRVKGNPGTFLPMDQIVPLAVFLPRRREELLEMLWADYTGKTITLRDTKNPRKPRTEVVPVPPMARTIIDALPKFDARILPYKKESVSKAFERACTRLKIEDLRFHDLRHEGISRLFEQGLAIQEVALVSGHLSWNMLRRYTHLKPEHVAEKLDARQ